LRFATERRSAPMGSKWFVIKKAGRGLGAIKVLCWLKNNAPGWIPAVNTRGGSEKGGGEKRHSPLIYSKVNCFYFVYFDLVGFLFDCRG